MGYPTIAGKSYLLSCHAMSFSVRQMTEHLGFGVTKDDDPTA